jgi:putative mRNA 3-end processing factor
VGRRPGRTDRSSTIAPVTWRDGVHLTGTPIWCDARRRRDICFVSSVDRVVRTGHGQLIGTSLTLELLGARGGGHLAVPLRQRFTLGTLRLELIPSGRGLGAAALHVDAVGRTVLYAGAVRTIASPLIEGAEVRTADALVVAAPLGELHHRLEPLDDVATRVIEWTRAQLAAGVPTVLVVENALDGIEVAARLVAEGVPVAAGKSIRDAVLRLAGVAGVPAIRAPGREPAVLIRAETDRVKLPSAPQAVTALVAARAIDPAPGWAASFAWPFVAGRDQLLAWIEQTRAREIFVTGPCADAIVTALGSRARLLGPPRQMALFG